MVVTSETSTVEPNATGEKKPRKVYARASRETFISLIHPSLLNPEGRITGVPQGFDPKLHTKPKRADFVNDFDYMEFDADIWDLKAAELSKKAERLRKNAADMKEYGDPAARKQVMKFQKMVNSLKELQAGMAKSGIQISLEELLADVQK